MKLNKKNIFNLYILQNLSPSLLAELKSRRIHVSSKIAAYGSGSLSELKFTLIWLNNRLEYSFITDNVYKKSHRL